MHEHLSERFVRRRKQQSGAQTSWDSNSAKEVLNRNIRDYVMAATAPPPSTAKPWLRKSEIPTREEILDDEDKPVELSENRLDRPWPNRKKYLETHYELLREDAISPFRDAIHHFKGSPDMCDDKNVSVYTKVHITGFTFAQKELSARLQFSTCRAGKSIAWEYSKRLIAGTLVAISPANDNFQRKCIIAVIAARPLDNVKSTPSMVDIFFARASEIEIDPQQEFVMIEARSGYFEGLRYTLKALQKLHNEKFPLAEHICNLKTKIEPPAYLESRPRVNLSSVFEKVGEEQAPQSLDILHHWPPAPEDVLDQSQWSALHQMLTHRLSIIQGPPGTGKTHVSVVGLRILLESKSSEDPPILVAAQTNHALDQILRHISSFDDNFIRLGGRSTNAEVKKHTIFEMRKKDNVRPPVGSLFGRAIRDQTELTKAMVETIAPLLIESADHPLSSEFLLSLGIITSAQAQSLTAGAAQWVSPSAGQAQDAMSIWLDKQLRPFELVYEQDAFSYAEDEKDEEYEQLKELEAEHGVDDEDDVEYLRGLFRVVEDKFTCRTHQTQQAQAQTLLEQNSDLWRIPERARGAVYRLFQQRAKAIMLVRFREQARQYSEICQRLQIGKWERDVMLLQKANVVGMTTTGFSKYRALVASLKPKIVLIEEAAEVLEGPVTAVCVESLEHLILVGDHQQLQGHCNVGELEEVFHLNISMFERLVRNKVPFKTLTRQRRMDPEIRRALAPIYQNLEDHPTVIGRPSVPGMGDVRSFFFDHNWSESSDSMLSKYNEQEAEFVVGFFCYLVRGGLVPPHGITVLTFYNGQRKLILKLLKQKEFLAGEYISVNTVDSYQGEENTVVLLSLVRSNEEGKIGFLEIANRVCVAMSRARLGFYIFGNATLLSQNVLWDQVISIMANDPNRVGTRFPIECINHGRQSEIEYPSDWEGRFGCNQKCGESLKCGHKCPLTCHSFPHEAVICQLICTQRLMCNHLCERECGEDCSCPVDCAEFARLSENLELAINGPLQESMDGLRVSRSEKLSNRYVDGENAAMEVRGNNMAEHHPATLARGAISSNGAVATGRPLREHPLTASSSSSGGSDPFRRLNPKMQLQSRTNWGAFASGGVRGDDLRRDKGVMAQKQRLVEQNKLSLGIGDNDVGLEDPEVGTQNITPVRNQTQTALRNGRIRYEDHHGPFATGSRRSAYDGAAARCVASGSKKTTPTKTIEKKIVNLIDFD